MEVFLTLALGIAVFGAMIAIPYGLYVAAFKSQKRMKGVKIIGAAFLGVVGVVASIAAYQIIVSSSAGFDSYTAYREALDAGVTDPVVWSAEGPAILAEQEAQRRQQAEAEEAARQAEEAARQAAEAERQAAEVEAEDRRAREAREAEAERLARQEQEREEDQRRGFHCLSAWDGSHRDFRNAVRDRMRDPDSFEHIETRVTPVDGDGMHMIMMQYRARNGFGGMNVGTALGQYRNSDCQFVIVSLE